MVRPLPTTRNTKSFSKMMMIPVKIFNALWESVLYYFKFFTDVIGVKWYLVFLDCISPNYGCSGNFFTCVWAIYIPSSVKCLFMAFAHFCSELFVFVSYWIIGIFYVLWKLFLRCMVCRYFLLFRRLLFHSVDCCIGCAEVFQDARQGSRHLASDFPSSSVESFSPEMVSCSVLFVAFQENPSKATGFWNGCLLAGTCV